MEQSAFVVFALCMLKLQIKYLENCFHEHYRKYFEKCFKLQAEFDAKGQVYISIASLTAIIFSVPVLTLNISYMISVSSWTLFIIFWNFDDL